MKDGILIEELRTLCNQRKFKWTAHVLSRLQERGIFRTDVRNAILRGEIIEQYPTDYPHPSCLLLGPAVNGTALHVVCGVSIESVFIVTAYIPTTDKFEPDLKTRKEHTK